MNSISPPTASSPLPESRYPTPTEANIHELVYAFYDRVRADALLGPVFEAPLAGRWDDHLPTMCAFWGSVVLGAKQYRGNVQQAHAALAGIEPRHFSRWLHLFLDTVEKRYEPAAAIRFMEPALRIAQSLQLSRFGWDYAVPEQQQALLDHIAPKRQDNDARDVHGEPNWPKSTSFPAKIIGRTTNDSDTSEP
jgi:hemoglobin